MVPAAAATVSPVPPPVTTTALVTPKATDGFVSEFAIVTATTAATPFAIALSFGPEAMQVVVPALLLHVTVFPALVRTVPADTLTALISLVSYENVHCRPLGTSPPDASSVRSSDAVPPAFAVPDARLSVCPAAGVPNKTRAAKAVIANGAMPCNETGALGRYCDIHVKSPLTHAIISAPYNLQRVCYGA
jgi:hypothetical protein